MRTANFAQNLLGMQAELHRFALKLTADNEEANDLLQETSLKALDNEEKYTPDTNFKGWMYTIMRNIFINNYRKTVRDQTFVDQTENLYHLNLPQDSGFESTEGNYDLKEIRKIVNSLPKALLARIMCATLISATGSAFAAQALYTLTPASIKGRANFCTVPAA